MQRLLFTLVISRENGGSFTKRVVCQLNEKNIDNWLMVDDRIFQLFIIFGSNIIIASWSIFNIKWNEQTMK